MSTLSLNCLNPFETYTIDVGMSMVSCIGYYLLKKLKNMKMGNIISLGEVKLKSQKQKFLTSLERWDYANNIVEYNQLITSSNEKTEPQIILKQMIEKGIFPNIDTYNALLLNCFQNDNHKDADILKKEILEHDSQIIPNTYTLNILIKGLNKKYVNLKRENKEIKEKQLLSKKFDDNTDSSDNSESSEQSGSDSEDKANNKKIRKDKKKLIQKIAYKSEKDLNNQFDEELVDIIQSLEKLQVFMDVFTQNTILESLVEQGRLDEAWNQFTNMKNFFQANYLTYKTILKCIRQSKINKDSKDSWLKKSLEILENVKENFTLDEVFLNILLEVCVNLNTDDSLNKAETLFEEMRNLEIENPAKYKGIVTEQTFCTLLKGYGRRENFVKALEVFNGLRERKDIQKTFLSYRRIIKACIKCKDFEKAEDYYYQMDKEGIEKNLNIYTSLLNGYRVQKNYNKAIDLYEEIKLKEVESNATIYNSLIDLCLETGNNEKINDIYLDFKMSATEDEDTHPDLRTYVMLLKNYIKLKNVPKVQDIFDYLKKRDDYTVSKNTYKKIFEFYTASCADDALVKNLWQEMKKKFKLGVASYGQLIQFYCKSGNFNHAFEIFEECIKIELKPGSSIYYSLINSQIKVGFMDRAITLFRNMSLRQVKIDRSVYELIIEGCIKYDRSEEALEFSEKSIKEKVRLDNAMYNIVLSLYINNTELKPYMRRDNITRFMVVALENNMDLEIESVAFHHLVDFLATKNQLFFDEKSIFDSLKNNNNAKDNSEYRFNNFSNDNFAYNDYQTKGKIEKYGGNEGINQNNNYNYNNSNYISSNREKDDNLYHSKSNNNFNNKNIELNLNSTSFVPKMNSTNDFSLYNQKSFDNTNSSSNNKGSYYNQYSNYSQYESSYTPNSSRNYNANSKTNNFNSNNNQTQQNFRQHNNNKNYNNYNNNGRNKKGDYYNDNKANDNNNNKIWGGQSLYSNY